MEQRLQWQNLPQSLTGQKVIVLKTNNKKAKGKLVRIEAAGLVLESGKGEVTIPRVETSRIETRSRTRIRGRIVGTAVGASVGIVLTAMAAKYANNEGGSTADALVGAAVGIAIGGAVLGYLAGDVSDGDRTVIYILPN